MPNRFETESVDFQATFYKAYELISQFQAIRDQNNPNSLGFPFVTYKNHFLGILFDVFLATRKDNLK